MIQYLKILCPGIRLRYRWPRIIRVSLLYMSYWCIILPSKQLVGHTFILGSLYGYNTRSGHSITLLLKSITFYETRKRVEEKNRLIRSLHRGFLPCFSLLFTVISPSKPKPDSW